MSDEQPTRKLKKARARKTDPRFVKVVFLVRELAGKINTTGPFDPGMYRDLLKDYESKILRAMNRSTEVHFRQLEAATKNGTGN